MSIKLVTADLDGTLLDSQKRLPPRLPQVLHLLRRRGVRFVAASGRQYYNLLGLFPHRDLLFIAENGGMIADGRTLLHCAALPEALLYAPLSKIRGLPGAHVVLCGAQSAYTDCGDDPIFLSQAHLYYAHLQIVPDLLAAARRDSICKLAVFLLHQAERTLYPALLTLDTPLQRTLSGDCWVDLADPAQNKGTAIHFLQRQYGLTPDECMAFGDYPNDLEMMRAVTYSYAMANAHPDLAAACRFRAPSNDEDGVVRTLIDVFQLPL